MIRLVGVFLSVAVSLPVAMISVVVARFIDDGEHHLGFLHQTPMPRPRLILQADLCGAATR